MKKYFSPQSVRNVMAIFLTVVIGLAANYASAVWQGPTGNPTENNPANILTTLGDQSKNGKLSVGGLDPAPAAPYGFQVGMSSTAYTTAEDGIKSYGPLAVFGNTGLFGNVTVGPKMTIPTQPVTFQVTGRGSMSQNLILGSNTLLTASNPNDLVVVGSTTTGSLQVGDNGDPEDTADFTLELRGNTNIGYGNTCSLTSDRMDDGCPLGSYLAKLNLNTGGVDSITGVCRYLEPAPDQPFDVGDCYGGGGGGGNGGGNIPLDVTIAHRWTEVNPYFLSVNDYNPNNAVVGVWTTSTIQPTCVEQGGPSEVTIQLDVNNSVAPIIGGVPPFTYQWSEKIKENVITTNPAPASTGWTVMPGPTTSPIRYVTVDNYYLNSELDSKFWKVVVTDSVGETATDIFAAHDILGPVNDDNGFCD